MNMDIGKITMKLIGQIEPTGDHGEDERRLENVAELMNVIDYLVGKLAAIEYCYRNDRLDSRREISEYILKWLKENKRWLNENEHY